MKSVYGYKLDNLREISQQMIQDAADAYRDVDPDNSFERLLATGKEFEGAGLTPIFLCDNSMQKVMVTTKEKLQKKLH